MCIVEFSALDAIVIYSVCTDLSALLNGITTLNLMYATSYNIIKNNIVTQKQMKAKFSLM